MTFLGILMGAGRIRKLSGFPLESLTVTLNNERYNLFTGDTMIIVDDGKPVLEIELLSDDRGGLEFINGD